MEAVVADPEFVDVEGDSLLEAAVLEYETPLPSPNDDVSGGDGEALCKKRISSLLTARKNKIFRGIESRHKIYLPKLMKTAHKYSPP